MKPTVVIYCPYGCNIAGHPQAMKRLSRLGERVYSCPQCGHGVCNISTFHCSCAKCFKHDSKERAVAAQAHAQAQVDTEVD